jgi:hypothetical protein
MSKGPTSEFFETINNDIITDVRGGAYLALPKPIHDHLGNLVK